MKDWSPQQIKKLLDRFGLSQDEFGERIGITRNDVYYLEKGVRQPSKTLKLLLDYIDMEADVGFYGLAFQNIF
jgi:DNA-binding transcriptional regulator YiaG